MSYTVIAQRYARAIFELSVEAGDVARVTEQVSSFAETYAHSDELKSVLDNPLVPAPAREAILNEVLQRLGLEGTALNALKLLAARRRIRAIVDIARELGVLSDRRAGILRATVTSATPLPESFYQRLVHELESATRRKIALDRRQDPSLIAGVVTRIGDNTIDGSLKGRLAEFERQLAGA